jgi:hypothetical protein
MPFLFFGGFWGVTHLLGRGSVSPSGIAAKSPEIRARNRNFNYEQIMNVV